MGSVEENVFGWFLILGLSLVIVGIGWFQWNAYRTLDQKIEQMDPSIIYEASTRVEKVLDAPSGSVVVPYVAATMVPVEQNVVQNFNVQDSVVMGGVGEQPSAVRLVDD